MSDETLGRELLAIERDLSFLEASFLSSLATGGVLAGLQAVVAHAIARAASLVASATTIPASATMQLAHTALERDLADILDELARRGISRLDLDDFRDWARNTISELDYHARYDRNGDGFADFDNDPTNGFSHLDPNDDGDTSDGYGNPDNDQIDSAGEDGYPPGHHGTVGPIILDLDNDGVEINFFSNAVFDIDQDGFFEQLSWVVPDDGFLVIDLNSDGSRGNGDGQIDQIRELAFALWGNDGDTDLQGFRRTFDANSDGILNDSDSVWSELRVWQDLDQDGKVGDGELRSLSDWGITQIDLGYDDGSSFEQTTDDITVVGNILHGRSSFTRNGEVISGGVGDVSLAASTSGWRRVETPTGFSIELEDGQKFQYRTLGETGPDDIDLVSAWLDGAVGNDNSNRLDAVGHMRQVALEGGDGADTLLGGHADDILAGGDGSDSLDGGAGNDLVFFDADDVAVKGGEGVDSALYTGLSGITFDLAEHGFERAIGGDGSDILVAEFSTTSAWLYGQGGSDLLRSGEANDLLTGGEGDDTIYAQGGDDQAFGGSGQDHVHGGRGDDHLLGGIGHDDLDGGSGDDYLSGGGQEDTLWGRDGDDTLLGDAENDVLRGEDGDDRLSGGEGGDRLMGGNGDDFLSGGDGRDTIYGGAGDDVAYGGAEYDLFFDGDGDDTYKGGDGDDIFELQTHSGQNVIQGGLGLDTLRLNGHRDMWQWESVHTTRQVQSGTIEGGPDGGQPIYTTVHEGKGQYLFYSGEAVVQVQDVEKVVFLGSSGTAFWSHTELENEEAFSLRYVASHDDLLANDEVDNTSSNWTIGREHWINYGQAENREVSFNPLQYLAANAAVYQLHGFDLTAATRHYIDIGHDAGLSRGDFDAEQYLKNYSDVRTLFGSDLSAATRHYIEHGLAAGRTDDAVSGAMNEAEFEAWLTSLADQDEVISLVQSDADEDNEATFYFASRDNLNIADPNAVIYGHAMAANNTSAGSGNDTIYADSTSTGHWLFLNQQESASGSEDTLRGGDGADSIYAGAEDDSVTGGGGSDGLSGQAGDDILHGENGNDTITGGEGQDTLFGQDGADALLGDLGDDHLYGGNGADRQWGGEGNDNLFGNDGADTLLGEDGNDTLLGHDGADALLGGEGNDLLDGMSGSDRLYGEAGNDSLVGDLGDDRLEGDVGDDTLSGGSGNDYLDGGDGDDSLSGGNAQDALFGGEGADTLDGGRDNDILYGNDGADRLDGGSANDILHGGAGADTLNGGDGIDAVSYAGSSEAVYVRLDGANASNFTGDAAGDVFSGIENLFGSELDDQLYGDASHNVLWSADGNDTLNGLAGNDDLMGGAGADLLNGGDGIDRLSGEDGADTLNGGADIDLLFGGDGDDQLQGGDGNDTLYGGDKNDSLDGGGDIDRLFGGEGNDTLNAGDGDGNWQYLYGEGGDDSYVYSTDHGKVYVGYTAEKVNQGANDTVTLTDLKIQDISFGTYDYANAHGVAIKMMWDRVGETSEFRVSNLGEHIEKFVFADGRAIDDFVVDDGTSNYLIGTNQDNALLSVGTQFQYLTGKLGDDVYIIDAAAGSNWITRSGENTGQGQDTVVFKGLDVSDFTIATRADSENGSAVNGTSLRLSWGTNYLELADEGSHIEEFIFADGRTANHFSIDDGSNVLSGTSANDVLVSSGTQFQYLKGGLGDDVYLVESSAGSNWITRTGENTGQGDDTVIFSDLNVSDITVMTRADSENGSGANGTSLRLSWGTSYLELADEGSHIEEFIFTDGTSLTSADLLNLI
ncbi:hypothetical protein J7426_14480 [Tropicibacter sp. R16_0]|uniref:calcium-binding protein n=1 Tax=Tropicibacter sp. R16_0 TaxID=2821102 RepID=UPI001ADC0EDF|nr:calcium-binding protein [Tropicibacter sp. R16_0]MBO9451477.1 hypothetical protein [Tropicibacter sp. R16_0]